MTKRVILIGVCASLAAACGGAPQPRASVATSAGCHELGDTSAAVAPVLQSDRVYAAREVTEKKFLARAIQPTRTMGAELYVRATPGTTSEYLERALSCHAARGNALHSNDPLHPTRGEVAELSVRSTGSGFAVRVIGEDHATGQEIWQRSRSLAEPSSSVTVEQVASVESERSSL